QFTSLALPTGMTNLQTLYLFSNQLTNLVMPPDLYLLTTLHVTGNQLTSLTLPAGSTNLTNLFVTGNPLTTLVLSQVQAARLAQTIATLRTQGVSIVTNTPTIQLIQPQRLAAGFQFGISGPPGVYTILASSNLVTWTALGTTTNTLGTV